MYSEAITRNPSDATLFCNRAYTRIKLEEHGYALHDACEPWRTPFLLASHFDLENAEMPYRSACNRTQPQICQGVLPVGVCPTTTHPPLPCPRLPRGHSSFGNRWLTLRASRAMCHIQILKPQLAVADLKRVLALEPQNAQVRKELESTQKLVRKIEFEKAIEMEEEKSAVERCLEIIAEGASALPCSLVFLSRSQTPD